VLTSSEGLGQFEGQLHLAEHESEDKAAAIFWQLPKQVGVCENNSRVPRQSVSCEKLQRRECHRKRLDCVCATGRGTGAVSRYVKTGTTGMHRSYSVIILIFFVSRLRAYVCCCKVVRARFRCNIYTEREYGIDSGFDQSSGCTHGQGKTRPTKTRACPARPVYCRLWNICAVSNIFSRARQRARTHSPGEP
jgi:hypothetical protein